MPRLSLPREAPRILIQRAMPSKDFRHSYWSGYTGYLDGASLGEQSIGGIQLSNSSYTDAIHNQYFVQKTFSFEVMYQPQTNRLSASTESLRSYFLTDQLFRKNIFNGITAGFRMGGDSGGGLYFNYTNSSGAGFATNTGISNERLVPGTWNHYVFVYEYNAVSPTNSVARFYLNGYLVNSVPGFFGTFNVSDTAGFKSFRKSGALQICGGTSHVYKYFRVLSNNPWPANGFEIADPFRPFTGSGQWMPGINDPQPYPTIDPASEIMKFNFDKHMAISDIRDLSQNSWPIDYIAPDASIKYANPTRP